MATKICEQAQICLNLLDQYESSVPGLGWSYAARKCQPLREELRRTDRFFRAASGEMTRRAGEDADSAPLYEPSPSAQALFQMADGELFATSETRAVSTSTVSTATTATYHGPNHPYPSDVDLWLEDDEPIKLRAVCGMDPVGLNADEARDLGLALIELADLSDEMQGKPE